MEKIKKRRSCCGCNPVFLILSPIIILVMLFSLIFVGALVAYNTIGKEYTGIELGQLFSIARNITKVDKDKIITNPYDPIIDLDSFYRSFKDAAYIKDECEINISDIINSTMNAGDTVESGETSDPFTNIEFDRDKLIDELGNISEGEYTPKTLELTDKQVAALLNELFVSQIDPLLSKNNLPTNSVKVEQVIISNGGIDKTSTDINMTINIQLHKIIDTILIGDASTEDISATNFADNSVDITSNIESSTGLSKQYIDFIGKAIKKVLPEECFASLTVQPYNPNGQITAKLNNMSDDDIKNTITMMDTLSSKLNMPSLSLTALFEKINTKVNEVFGKVDEMVNVAFTTSALQIQPIQTLINLMKLENVTEQELMTTLRSLIVIDESTIIQEENKYSEKDLDTFFVQLKQKYAIDSKFDLNSANFLQNETLSALPNNINFVAANFDFDKSVNDMLLEMNGKQLAALIASQLNNIADSNNELFKSLFLNQVKIIKNADTSSTSYDYYIEAVFSIKIKEYITKSISSEDQSNLTSTQKLLNSMLDTFLPESIYISSSTGINVNEDNTISNYQFDSENIGTTICLNNLDYTGTVDKFAIVEKLLTSLGQSTSSDFSINTICSLIDENIKKVFTSLKENESLSLDVRLGTQNGNSYLLLPSVYEVIQTKANVHESNASGNEVISLEEIQSTLKEMIKFNTDEIVQNSSYSSSDADAFLNDLKAKYAITSINNPLNDSIDVDNYNESNIKNIELTSKNFTNTILLNDLKNRINIRTMEFKSQDEMKVAMQSNNFGAILNQEIEKQLSTEATSGYRIQLVGTRLKYITVNNAPALQIELVIKIDMQSKDLSNLTNRMIANILANDMYITAVTVIDIDDTTDSLTNINYDANNIRTNLLVNAMNNDTTTAKLNTLNKIIAGLGTTESGSTINKTQIESQVDQSIRNALNNMFSNDTFGNITVLNNNDELSTAYLCLPNIYEIVQTQAHVEDSVTTEDIRTILSDIYEAKNYTKLEYDDGDLNIFIENLNDNYFLQNEGRLSSDLIFNNNSTSGIDAIKESLSNDFVNFYSSNGTLLDGLFYTTKTNEELRSTLDKKAFAVLFADKLCNQSINGIKETSLINAEFIMKDIDKNQVNLRAKFQATINMTTPGQLLPEMIYFTIDVPFNYTSDSKSITINDLGDTMTPKLFEIFAGFSGSNAISYDNLLESISSATESITNLLNSNTSEIGINFVFENGSSDVCNIQFPSIFDYINTLIFTGTDKLSDNEMDTFVSLIKKLNTYSVDDKVWVTTKNTDNTNNEYIRVEHDIPNELQYSNDYPYYPYTENDLLPLENYLNDLTERYFYYSDKCIAAIFNESMQTTPIFNNIDKTSVQSVKLISRKVLTDSFDETNMAKKEAVSWGLEEANNTCDYISMVNEISLTYNPITDNDANILEKARPNRLYFSFLTTLNSSENTTSTIRINNFTDDECAILIDIINKQRTATNELSIETLEDTISQFVDTQVSNINQLYNNTLSTGTIEIMDNTDIANDTYCELDKNVIIGYFKVTAKTNTIIP